MLKFFFKSENGNTAIVFALSSVVLVAALGAAIDFNFVDASKTKLNAAADAAILAAVKTADATFTAGSPLWNTKGVAAGNLAFKKNLPDNLQSASIALNITHVGNTFSGTATYDYVYPTAYMGLFGTPTVHIVREVAASERIQNYLDVHLLIDVSPSMGIGATDADQTLLHNATGCALACHYSLNNIIGSNYTAARATGAKLRIDVVREATQQLIADMRARSASSDQVRLSIDLYSNSLIPLVAPTTDLVAAEAAAGQIDLTDLIGHSGSMTEYSLAQLASQIGTSGNGYTSSTRKSYVVLISDGTQNSIITTAPVVNGAFTAQFDANYVTNSPNFVFDSFETVSPIKAIACKPIKDAGHTLLTGHVDYLIPSAANGGNDSRFNFIANNLLGVSQAQFKACASDPSFAYTAKTPQDISTMYQNILDDILPTSNLALTK
jgi:Flp pilus assembly protein TadG